jgi:hypothetical protein
MGTENECQPVDCRQISELEQQLRGEVARNINLKPAIDDVREKILELRTLFKTARCT